MIGTTLAHYRITGELGSGGMGEVWRAIDTKLDCEVALKVFDFELATEHELAGLAAGETNTPTVTQR